MSKSPSCDNSEINESIGKIYWQLTLLKSSHPHFLEKIKDLQEEIAQIKASASLSADQEKAIQMEDSCIEDMLALLSIQQEMRENPNPTKALTLKLKYTLNDIEFCLQNLKSLFPK